MHFAQNHLRSFAAPATAVATLIAFIPCATAQDADQEYEEHAIDEIIVQGAALDRTVEQLAQPTAIVGGDALAKKQAASLGETISQELGVSSSYFGPVASRPIIRGQFGERVRVLSNALDSLDASALSEDHAVSVDSALAERVEIVRGPATLLYGSGAAGGLVNVIDGRIRDTPMQSPMDGMLALGTDSATGTQSLATQLNIGNERVATHFDYYRRATDDVEIPGFVESSQLRAIELIENGGIPLDEAAGTVTNTDSETTGGAVAMTLTGDAGFIGFSLSEHNSNYGVPGHGHEDAGPVESVRIDLEQSRFDVKGEYELPQGSELRFRLARNDYLHTEFEGDAIGTIFDTGGVDARIEWRHGQIGPIEGTLGLQSKTIDFDAIGDEAFVPPSTTKQTSLFVFEEWPISDRLIMQGSGRVERQSISTPVFPVGYSDNALGGSVGLVWLLNEENSIAVNYALTERHPNSTELFADGAHVAVDRIERGSVVLGMGLLDRELSSNIDIALRGDSERIEWEIALFMNDIDDYILLSPTAGIEDDLQIFEYRQTSARLTGFEAEARIELLETNSGHLHTRLFSDYVRGENRTTNENLPRIPPLRYGAGLHYTMDRFEAGLELRIHQKQHRVASNELPTDAYTLLSAEVSYVWTDPEIMVFLRAKNLGDEDARQHTSPLKESFPLPGRSIQLGVRYDF